jgi:hypothetical protein
MSLIQPQQETKAKTLLRRLVKVPLGHTLPMGNRIVHPFDVTVEAGARWHPDWTEPRITVNAFRFMAHGDAIGFAGDRVNAFPLPEDVATLVPHHGMPIDEEARTKLAALGLAIPEKAEKIGAFIPQRASTIQ